MKISYDPEVDALYIRFSEKVIQAITHRLTEDIAVNYDAKGEIVGIEVLSAHEHLVFSGKQPRLEAENLKLAS